MLVCFAVQSELGLAKAGRCVALEVIYSIVVQVVGYHGGCPGGSQRTLAANRTKPGGTLLRVGCAAGNGQSVTVQPDIASRIA